MRCALKKAAVFAALGLAALTAPCLSPEAIAQTVNIPLQLEQGATGVILTINVGINGAAPRPYLFDTGSALFNALYSPAAFGGLPDNMASKGLPTGLFYSYGDNPNGTLNEFDSNVIAVPSLTFYATTTSTSGVTVNATTSSGTASNFYVNAVYAQGGNYLNGDPSPLKATSTFGGYYGIFGASGIVDLFNSQSTQPSLPPLDGSNSNPIYIGGILGQTVVSGTTAGYVVAANGQALSSLQTGAGPVPGSTVNGPQPTHCAIASCDPAVMLGLTPALLAQFAPINTQAATQTPGYVFPNSGATGWATFPTTLTVTVNFPGQGSLTFTQRSLLDSGTPNNQLFEYGGFPSNGVAVPRGATVTISDGIANSAKTSFVSSPTPFGAYPYPNDPYGVSISSPAGSPDAFFGVGFFLQNSVLFDLAGDAIGWTPNYVTAANIVTTPSSPLVIGSDSVPLGLAGVISGDGGVAITQGGSATLSGTNTYTGATTINGGYLALVGPGSISASSSVNVSAGGIFDISGVTLLGGAVIQSLAGDSNGAVYLGPNTLTLFNASGSYAGVIYGSGGLTLNGGVETLSGIDAYGGATTVNGGFLVINGVLAGTSNVTVNAGGALGGDGIIDPPAVTIASGGTLAPGKPGVAGSGMMIIGDLVMQPGSTFMSLVGAGGASFASVSGTATLAGTATAAFAGGPLSKQLTILSSSGLNGTTFDNFTTVNLPQSLSAGISYDSNKRLSQFHLAHGGHPWFDGKSTRHRLEPRQLFQ
jgi:autotransporter-associated beta strand protein